MREYKDEENVNGREINFRRSSRDTPIKFSIFSIKILHKTSKNAQFCSVVQSSLEKFWIISPKIVE